MYICCAVCLRNGQSDKLSSLCPMYIRQYFFISFNVFSMFFSRGSGRHYLGVVENIAGHFSDLGFRERKK